MSSTLTLKSVSRRKILEEIALDMHENGAAPTPGAATKHEARRAIPTHRTISTTGLMAIHPYALYGNATRTKTRTPPQQSPDRLDCPKTLVKSSTTEKALFYREPGIRANTPQRPLGNVAREETGRETTPHAAFACCHSGPRLLSAVLTLASKIRRISRSYLRRSDRNSCRPAAVLA